MAVQIRLMGDQTEVEAVMTALVAGEPVTVLADGGIARNKRDNPDGRQVRAFGMAQLGVSNESPTRQAHAERMDRPQRALPRTSGAVRRRR